MKIYQKIRSFLSCISFSNPKKERIVIFDAEGSEVIITTILSDMPYVVLPVRGEKFFISFQILLLMIKKIRFADLINLRIQPINYYFLSCIEYIKPSVVITYIDNNFTFQWVSKNYRDAEFIAIENGHRNIQQLWEFLPVVHGEKVRYFFNHFFCYGQKEVDDYARFGHTILHAHKVGSLKAGYYRAQVDVTKILRQYDICLISQYRFDIMKCGAYPEIKNAILILCEFFKRFVDETGVTFCIAMNLDSPEMQANFYHEIFGSNVKLIEQKPGSFFSSYEAFEMSEVSLAMDSNLGLEAFCFGKKVLFCNFTGDKDDNYDIACPEICRMNIIDYDLFAKKLNDLLAMEKKIYLEKTEKDRNYLFTYDPAFPAHQVVRQLIRDINTAKI